jgi:DNA-binding transcriptional ArsR family regulator
MTNRASDEPIDVVLGALADPTRRALFEATLREPGLTTSQLAARTKSMSRWGVIKHLAVLRDAGLIQTMATGRLRRHYAERGALGPLRNWLDGLRDS